MSYEIDVRVHGTTESFEGYPVVLTSERDALDTFKTTVELFESDATPGNKGTPYYITISQDGHAPSANKLVVVPKS